MNFITKTIFFQMNKRVSEKKTNNNVCDDKMKHALLFK